MTEKRSPQATVRCLFAAARSAWADTCRKSRSAHLLLWSYTTLWLWRYDQMISMIVDELPHSCFVIVGDCWSPGRQYRRQPCSPRPSRWDHGGRQTGCAGVLVSSPRESWKKRLWRGIWFLNILNFNVFLQGNAIPVSFGPDNQQRNHQRHAN